MVEPMFLKSTVAFVAVPGVVGSGEIACKDMLAVDAGEGGGVGEGVVGVGLGVGAPPPATWTEKEFVARPAPPCHSSNPASTSIRYHEGLM
jgi:hypothetical protein